MASLTYTEAQIGDLLRERKQLPTDFRERFRVRPKRGHGERDIDIAGEDGSNFRVIVRQSQRNLLDFSVVLAVLVPNTTTFFRLRRYNGRSHEHTNHLEEQKFYDFHIHYATERYQMAGHREDAYAAPTDRYQDLRGALSAMVSDCGFVPPGGMIQVEMFG